MPPFRLLDGPSSEHASVRVMSLTYCENPLFDLLEVATKSKLATKSEFAWLLPIAVLAVLIAGMLVPPLRLLNGPSSEHAAVRVMSLTCCENPLFDMLEVATKSKLATKSEFAWLLPIAVLAVLVAGS